MQTILKNDLNLESNITPISQLIDENVRQGKIDDSEVKAGNLFLTDEWRLDELYLI